MTVLTAGSAVLAAVLFLYFLLPDKIATWRPRMRKPRADLWMVPVLAILVGLLSFWIAEQASAEPMALAGLAAYLLALSYVRWPSRRRTTVEVSVTDVSPSGEVLTVDKLRELDGTTVIEAHRIDPALAAEGFRNLRSVPAPLSRIGQ